MLILLLQVANVGIKLRIRIVSQLLFQRVYLLGQKAERLLEFEWCMFFLWCCHLKVSPPLFAPFLRFAAGCAPCPCAGGRRSTLPAYPAVWRVLSPGQLDRSSANIPRFENPPAISA